MQPNAYQQFKRIRRNANAAYIRSKRRRSLFGTQPVTHIQTAAERNIEQKGKQSLFGRAAAAVKSFFRRKV